MDIKKPKSVIKISFWKLFFINMLWTFTTFGGGNALIVVIKKTVVEKYKWLTEKEFENNFIITNLLPGPSAIQMFSYINIKLLGFTKGFILTIFAILPHTIFAFLLIYFSKYIPINYLYVLNVAVICSIVGILLVFCFNNIFTKRQSKKEHFLWILLFLFSFLFNFLVPSPFNLPIIFLSLMISVFFIAYRIKKAIKDKNEVTHD